MQKEMWKAVWIFVGITVGAGIFGLPYVFANAGFWTALAVIIFVGIFMSILTLYLGEVTLSSKEKHQLTGLAEKFLGKPGKWLMFLVNILSIYGALAAYIVGGGTALYAIFGWNLIFFNVLFFIFVAPAIYFGVNIIEGFETIFTPLKIVIVFILGILLLGFIDFGNLVGFSFSRLLIPYGVAIFAFSGFSAIPIMNEELKNKRNMLWAIILGVIISFILQLIFVISVVGALGDVDQVATTNLKHINFGVGLFANLFAFFAMATAFVALGFALKQNFKLDMHMGNKISWALTVLIPLVLVFSGFFSFVRLLELSGAVAVAVILILILFMHSKAKILRDRRPEFQLADNKILKLVIFILLIIGILYSLGVF